MKDPTVLKALLRWGLLGLLYRKPGAAPLEAVKVSLTCASPSGQPHAACFCQQGWGGVQQEVCLSTLPSVRSPPLCYLSGQKPESSQERAD